MKVPATIVKHTREEVTITTDAALAPMYAALRAEAKVPYDAYVNAAGKWEDWDDCRGHGSGLTTVHREATEDERAVWNALELLRRKYESL